MFDDEEKIKKIANQMIDYWFSKLLERLARGQSFQEAVENVRQEILDD